MDVRSNLSRSALVPGNARGASMVEYVLLLALLSILPILTIGLVGDTLADAFNKVTTAFGHASPSGDGGSSGGGSGGGSGGALEDSGAGGVLLARADIAEPPDEGTAGTHGGVGRAASMGAAGSGEGGGARPAVEAEADSGAGGGLVARLEDSPPWFWWVLLFFLALGLLLYGVWKQGKAESIRAMEEAVDARRQRSV